MYKLLIVDDEKLIRKGIQAKLAYHGMEFSWVGEAANGREALAVMEAEKPHIVITDIRMPVMDGIQFIRRSLELHPKTKFVIISGFAEFEYAEQALNMGVSGYILKPIDDQSLVQMINKVMKEIASASDSEKTAREAALLEKDKESLLQERVLNQVLHTSRSFDKEELLRQIGVKAGGRDAWYILAILHVDSSSYSHSPFRFEDLELIKFSVRNILEEIPCDCEKILVNNQNDINQLFLLFYGSKQEVVRKACEKYSMDSFAKIRKFLGISVTLALSGAEEELTSEIYRQARTAFDQRLVQGSNQLYFFERTLTSPAISIPEHKLKLLQRCMEICDMNNIRTILCDLFLSGEAGDLSGVYIRLVYSEVVSSLLKVCSLYRVRSISDTEFLSGELLEYFENAAQIVEYLYSVIEGVLGGKAANGADCKKVIEEVKAHIRNHYADDLSVADLAKRYAINPDYLSSMFKQETGTNLIKYLTELRIEKACRLLQDTQSGVSDISYSVGYQDRQYFNRVFKKITGMTPVEYRNARYGGDGR